MRSLDTLAVVSNRVSPADRRAFIAERRQASAYRFDTLHSPRYDENWGAISPSHAAFVTRLTTLIRPGGDVLDAACGTGKYWPTLLAAGLRVTGADQSAGMLAQARGWLTAAGFRVEDEQEADYYWHFLLERQ
jgi:SAM-dependent methyltransferase